MLLRQVSAQIAKKYNVIASTVLTLAGYNGHVVQIAIKPVARKKIITVPHTKERIELLSQAKMHGQLFTARGMPSHFQQHFQIHIKLKKQKNLV
jgi:hypothetical protein